MADSACSTYPLSPLFRPAGCAYHTVSAFLSLRGGPEDDCCVPRAALGLAASLAPVCALRLDAEGGVPLAAAQHPGGHSPGFYVLKEILVL